jgi:hypothetical protein
MLDEVFQPIFDSLLFFHDCKPKTNSQPIEKTRFYKTYTIEWNQALFFAFVDKCCKYWSRNKIKSINGNTFWEQKKLERDGINSNLQNSLQECNEVILQNCKETIVVLSKLFCKQFDSQFSPPSDSDLRALNSFFMLISFTECHLENHEKLNEFLKTMNKLKEKEEKKALEAAANKKEKIKQEVDEETEQKLEQEIEEEDELNEKTRYDMAKKKRRSF